MDGSHRTHAELTNCAKLDLRPLMRGKAQSMLLGIALRTGIPARSHAEQLVFTIRYFVSLFQLEPFTLRFFQQLHFLTPLIRH